MKIIATSDLHGTLPPIPECDLLIIAGDITFDHRSGRDLIFLDSYVRSWLDGLPAGEVVFTPGNHDFAFQNGSYGRITPLRWHLLIDQEVTIGGLRIYGTPWTPTFFNWAFMKDDADLAQVFNRIPEGLDILISHGPPYGKCDRAMSSIRAGSKALLERLHIVQPRVMFCGHIHEGYGFDEVGRTRVYNVSHMNHRYMAINAPVEINLEPVTQDS